MTEITTGKPVSQMLDDITLSALRAESMRAHVKHGPRGGSLFDPRLAVERKLAAVGEEFGEVCRALTYDSWQGQDHLVKELLQLANTAASWAQCIDRHGMAAPTAVDEEGSRP